MKWIKSPWTISLGTAVFSMFLAMIYDYLIKNPFLSTIIEVVKWVSNKIILILNYEIKVWWILCAILAIVIVIVFINLKRGKIIKPDFYNYRKDTLKDWTWTWDWQYDSKSRKWDIINLIVRCPSCDTPMYNIYNGYYFDFKCPRCDYNTKTNNVDIRNDVKIIIKSNIEKKIYKK